MLERSAIFNDIHLPFENKRCVKLAIEIVKRFRPDTIYLLGDVPEFETVSAHQKRCDAIQFLQYEIQYTNEWIEELHRTFMRARIVWIAGNHEYRFNRYLARCAPELFGMFSLEDAFKLRERHYLTWIPYAPRQYHKCGNANLWLRHEPLAGGAGHAKATAENVEFDTAYGHTHTIQSYTHKRLGGERVRAYALPAMCQFNHPTFNYRGPKDRWVNGFTIVETETSTGNYHLQSIETTTGTCIVNGKLYRLKDFDSKSSKREPPIQLIGGS